MNYTTVMNLNIDPSGAMPVVRVKQGDASARILEIHLFSGTNAWTPEEGLVFTFRCEKPDGTAVITDSITTDYDLGRRLIILDDDILLVELVPQVTAVPGVCKCDICITKDEKVLSTIPFVVFVVQSPNIANTVVSSDDFHTMTNAISALGDIGELSRGYVFRNITVPAGSFMNDNTYPTYPYRASVEIPGVRSWMIPEVIFDVEQADSGIFSPVSVSYYDGVYIYATEQPGAFTIPTVFCISISL